jgi:hypothetical protein
MNTAGLSFLGSKAKPTAEAIARWCEGEGVGLEFDKRSGHPCAILTLNRQTRKVFFSSTPSDWRDAENSLVNIKKAARELGWEPRKEAPMETVAKSLADLPRLVEPPEPHSVEIRLSREDGPPRPPHKAERDEWIFERMQKGGDQSNQGHYAYYSLSSSPPGCGPLSVQVALIALYLSAFSLLCGYLLFLGISKKNAYFLLFNFALAFCGTLVLVAFIASISPCS